MQKINFHKLLMPSVLDGSKWMTRRAEPCLRILNDTYGKQGMSERVEVDPNGDVRLYEKNSNLSVIIGHSRYKVGEVVAISQSYQDLFDKYGTGNIPELRNIPFNHKGWNNKLFVRADLMPSRIQFTDIKVEKLQDISNEDCIKEGVYTQDIWSDIDYCFENICFETAQEAFRYMLSECCKPKTLWDDNPWVFAYSYELVK